MHEWTVDCKWHWFLLSRNLILRLFATAAGVKRDAQRRPKAGTKRSGSASSSRATTPREEDLLLPPSQRKGFLLEDITGGQEVRRLGS